MRIFADEWGKLVYSQEMDFENIIVREGPLSIPGGRSEIPVKILMSDRVLKCYDRSLTGYDKVREMDLLTGQWLRFISSELTEHIKNRDQIAWLNILFGGRFPRVPYWFRKFLGDDVEFGVIAVKNERELDEKDKYGWQLNRWGFLPTFNGEEPWKPMSDKEKRALPFEQINAIPPNYFKTNVLVIIEGASASGGTLYKEIENQIKIRKRFDLPLIKNIYFFVVYGSILSAQLAYLLCKEHDINLHFCFAGSAINVSREGLLPGLPYTDLSHLDRGSITFRRLYKYNREICIDLDGNPVDNRCSCGDVGESLDDAEEYYVSLIIENLILRIPLHVEGLMKYWTNYEFLFRLRRRIERIEKEHGIKLKNSIGERLLEVISKHELSLSKKIPISM